MMEHVAKRSAASYQTLIFFVALWLIGWTVRIPILNAPPLAIYIAADFGLAETGIAALTMLPLVMVAFGAIPAVWIIARFGLKNALIAGLLLMAAASVSRGLVSSTTWLFVMSLLLGFGVATVQTALPAAAKAWISKRAALASLIYLNGMMVGELFSAGLTLPFVFPLSGEDWRLTLVLWALPVILVAVLVSLMSPAQETASTDKLSLKMSVTQWSDKQVWQFGVLLASCTIAFLIVNVYLPVLLIEKGEAYALEALLFGYNATPLLGSLLVLFLPHWVGRRAPLALLAIVVLLSLAGFVFLSGWLSWLCALIVGFASTAQFILIMSLPPILCKGIAVARLSAGMSLLGFGIAFVISLAGGALADASARLEMAFVPTLLFMLLALLALGRKANYS